MLRVVVSLMLINRAISQTPNSAALRYPVWCESRFVELLDALRVIKPQHVRYAEVGVYTGQFSSVVWKALRPVHMDLMDLWKDSHEAAYENTTFAQREDGTTFQVYRRSNMKRVANLFARQIDNGRVVLHQGLSINTIRKLNASSIDVAYIDSLHDYATPADELALMSTKMRPSGLLCGHDYTHAAGSRYYNKIPKRDQGDAYNSFGVIEAVHEFLMFNPAWFLALRTSVRTQRSHTSYCLAQHAHFPHDKYQELQTACKEDSTLEKAAADTATTIDLKDHKLVLD